MKKITIIFAVLLSIGMSMAQDIMIESFRQLETDLTANTTGTMVLDQNGEKCALIKVSTSQTDFTFDAGMMGIVKTIQKPSEIWLYVPAGVKRLTISHVGMEALRDYDLGMSVQKACTYLLVLKTTKDVTLQTVTFKVSPANAMVMIEATDKDSDFGRQPLPLSSNGEGSAKIPVGEYRYTAIANGYNVEDGIFTLTASAPRKIIMELAPMAGTTPVQPTPVVAAVPTTPAIVSPEKSPSNLTFTVNGVSFKMIAVQGGTFDMASNYHVTLSSYHIGETEVTQELWEAVMGSNPVEYYKGPQLPVQNVSWQDCQQFISKLNSLTGNNFRLPTEAEWQFAARGGNKSSGYTYSGSNDIGSVAWYKDNSGNETHPVKTKMPNELGIYDMSGNVWEWCSDRFGKYPSEHAKNPTGPSSSSYRVFRGGSYYCDASCCCASGHLLSRGDYDPSDRDYSLGLRLGF